MKIISSFCCYHFALYFLFFYFLVSADNASTTTYVRLFLFPLGYLRVFFCFFSCLLCFSIAKSFFVFFCQGGLFVSCCRTYCRYEFRVIERASKDMTGKLPSTIPSLRRGRRFRVFFLIIVLWGSVER